MRIRSVVSKALLLAVAFAPTAAAQRAESSIAISATIAAPVETLPADAPPPERRDPGRGAMSVMHARDAAAAAPLALPAPAAPAPRRTAASARYLVRVRLDSASGLLPGRSIVVRDADDRVRRLERGEGVTIVRGATAAAAQAAVVRLRVDGRRAAGAGVGADAGAVHVVYEVTTESALTM